MRSTQNKPSRTAAQGKLEERISNAEDWIAKSKGKDIGISKLTLIIANIITLIVAIIALVLKFVK
jgi:hypothetical protein